MKKLVAIALVATGIASSAMAQETLQIATEGAYPPFNNVTSSGELIGFDVDIAKALCAEMKRDCEIVAQDWDGIIPGLMNGKYDAIVASMSITEERLQVIDFTDPYYSNFLSIVGRADAGLTMDDLANVSIGAQRATIGAQWAEDEYGRRGQVRLYDTVPAGFADLKAGRIDAVVSDFLPAMDWMKDNPEFGYIAEKIDFDDKIGIGIRHGEDDLKAAFNAALRAIRENGTYAEINDKYFDIDIF